MPRLKSPLEALLPPAAPFMATRLFLGHGWPLMEGHPLRIYITGIQHLDLTSGFRCTDWNIFLAIIVSTYKKILVQIDLGRVYDVAEVQTVDRLDCCFDRYSWVVVCAIVHTLSI